MMSGPVVVDVFKERWVEDLDLGGGQRYLSKRYAWGGAGKACSDVIQGPSFAESSYSVEC